AHRDAAPLLEFVEAALDDVASLVALLLGFAEVDGPARLPAAVRDLVVAFRDRRGDLPLPQPRPVLLRRVALVGEHPIRAPPRTADSSRDADLLECGGHHRGVVDVRAGDHPAQRTSTPVADEMHLARQPATGAADPV